MYEKITFINHLDESINFGENGIFVNENELHDYAWNYASDNGRIGSFSKGVVTKNVPVVIACANADEGVKAINNLMEYAEKDVLAGISGKIVIGGYYYKCFIVGSKKKRYSGLRGFINAELKVASDNPMWIKEISRNFSRNSTELSTGQEGGKNLDFPYGQPFDFTSGSAINGIDNTGFVSADFRLTIHGEANNPKIFIGGHEYSVTGAVGPGETLIIDSKEKSIILYKANGTTDNYFKNRNRNSYIFEKIAPGVNKVSWVGEFDFSLTLYEERSEPKWT